MSKTDKFMPFYPGDYLADTTMLTRDQHGGYFLLILAYWRNKGPLPDNDEALAMASRSTPQDWKKLRPILAKFFQVVDGEWRHKRIDDELTKAEEKYASRVAASRKANSVRHGVRDGVRDGNRHGSQPQPHIFINKNRARAAARDQTAAPPAHVEDWADEFPQWRSFKASLHPTEWATWFADARPNGSTASLVAETPFQRDRVAAQYLPRLLSHFGEDFKLKLKGE